MQNEIRTPISPTSSDTPVRGELRGKLSDVSVTQILNLIHIARKTGTLKFYEPTVAKNWFASGNGAQQDDQVPDESRAAISFRNGEIIRAYIRASGGTLLDMLQRYGCIDAARARLIRTWHNGRSEKALALRLINADYITQADVISGVEQHSIECVYEIMTWREGAFKFEEWVMPPPDQLTVSINTRMVVKEGALRTNEIRRLERELPNLKFALKFPSDVEQRFDGVNLSVDEWRVVSYVNPSISVGQIASLCQMTDSEIRRIVYRLLEAGVVEMVEPMHRRRFLKRD